MEVSSPNTTLDDIAAVIGFTPTITLMQWFGGTNIYIPKVAKEGHFIANVVGISAMARLVSEYADSTLYVPAKAASGKTMFGHNKREIVELLRDGKKTHEIAQKTGLHPRLVQRVKVQAMESGAMEIVQKSPGEAVAIQAGADKIKL